VSGLAKKSKGAVRTWIPTQITTQLMRSSTSSTGWHEVCGVRTHHRRTHPIRAVGRRLQYHASRPQVVTYSPVRLRDRPSGGRRRAPLRRRANASVSSLVDKGD
jgi:hypothetical protein